MQIGKKDWFTPRIMVMNAEGQVEYRPVSSTTDERGVNIFMPPDEQCHELDTAVDDNGRSGWSILGLFRS